MGMYVSLIVIANTLYLIVPLRKSLLKGIAHARASPPPPDTSSSQHVIGQTARALLLWGVFVADE